MAEHLADAAVDELVLLVRGGAAALDLLRDPQAFYRRGRGAVKYALTKVIFTKLYSDMQEVTLVSSHDLAEGLGDLIEADQRRRTYYRHSDSLSGWEGDTWSDGAGTTAGPSRRKSPRLMILVEQTYSAGPWWGVVRVEPPWWGRWGSNPRPDGL